MINEKMKKKIVIGVTIVIVVLIIWFLIISPLIQFKKSEKILLEAGKRYFEVNSTHLPTGTRVKTISLQTLYDKDFISEDLKVPNSSKTCDSKSSWIKVQKKDNEYKYHVYLKCGIFSSKVDHKGPTITLNGEEEVTINKGDEYKDPGIKSIEDNTDGKMDVKDVKIDNSNLNTNKNGTYQITYTIKDSLNNETVKIRTVKVVQILDKMVENETDKTNYYKGQNDNNYIKLDGILFKIVGLNDDGSVKITSSEPLAFVDYNSVDTWLNDYFYEKLSDSAKEYIKTDSKWCDEKISDTTNYTKCDSYSKKKAVGLLSVADINNSKDKDGKINTLSSIKESWTSNQSSDNKQISVALDQLKTESKSDIKGVQPTLNLKKNIEIKGGSGTYTDPYIVKNIKAKPGTKIGNLKTGEYIEYSGYTWRTIDSDSDGNMQVVMINTLSDANGYYTINFDENKSIYNPNSKTNIGYKIINEASKYINTKYFVSKDIIVNQYKDNIKYNSDAKIKKYTVKLSEVSLFDLFSGEATDTALAYWYRESSSNSKKAYIEYIGNGASYEEYNFNTKMGVKVIGYFNKDISIKYGSGTVSDPYQLTK